MILSWTFLLMTIRCRMIYPLLKGPLKMRKRLRGTSKSQSLADIVTPCRAKFTLQARQADLESYSIPHFDVTDF
jgi:hypothetical protein